MKTRIIAMIALSIALGSAEAALTTNNWLLFSGKWEDGAHWDQGVPSSDDAVNVISNGLAGTVTVDTATVTQHVMNGCMTVSNLIIGGIGRTLFLNNANTTPGNIGLTILNSFTITSSGSLSITNSRLRVGLPGGFFSDDGSAVHNDGSVLFSNVVTFIGNNGFGALTIRGGTWSSIGLGETDVGNLAGSVGTLTVSGGAATFSFGGLDIARTAGSAGTVWLTGGQLNTDNAAIGEAGAGQMTASNGVWQNGTTWVGLFFGAQGTLTVAGGTNTLTEYLSVGDQGGATGAVWMTGGQLTITNNATLIGGLGVGQMTVSNGTWRINAISAGSFPGSVGTLTIAGGTNTFITSTSVSFPNYLDVGRDAAATGAVWVTGGQLIMTNMFAQIGNSGVGRMTVSNGTWISGALRVGTNPGSQGTLTVAGGTNTLTGSFSLGDQPGATGALWVSGGQLVAQSFFDVGLNGVGQMTASNGNVQLSTLNIAPNRGAKGTFTMAGGSTVLGLGGLTVGFSPDSTGAVWMTGGQLIGTNGDTFVGGGSGRITVSNGNWQASNVFLGIYLGGAGTMTAVGGVSAMTNLVLGDCTFDIQGFLVVKGGSVLVTNAAGNAVLDVRNGYVALDAGQLVVDKIVMTNECGYFFHFGGILSVDNVLLDPNLDADLDGLPNGWEQAHGLDPLSSLGNDGPDGDPDHDGFTNLEEYEAGTDPNNPNSSPLQITSVVRQGNNLLLTWTTTGGKTNVVQFTKGAVGGSYSNNFTDLSPIIVPNGIDLTTTNYLDLGGATNKPSRYYRVRLVP